MDTLEIQNIANRVSQYSIFGGATGVPNWGQLRAFGGNSCTFKTCFNALILLMFI